MHEFSVNHMRTTNAHNSLSAQSDKPDFVNCVWSDVVLTGPDQAGVKGFV